MEVRITRNMTVADGGVTRQFTKGQSVSVSADVAHRLFRTGAAHKLSLEKGKVTSDASKTVEADPATEKPDLSGLDGMTKDQLLEFAETHNVPDVNSSMNKAPIADAIRAHFA